MPVVASSSASQLNAPSSRALKRCGATERYTTSSNERTFAIGRLESKPATIDRTAGISASGLPRVWTMISPGSAFRPYGR